MKDSATYIICEKHRNDSFSTIHAFEINIPIEDWFIEFWY